MKTEMPRKLFEGIDKKSQQCNTDKKLVLRVIIKISGVCVCCSKCVYCREEMFQSCSNGHKIIDAIIKLFRTLHNFQVPFRKIMKKCI